ncbi:MAG: YitT family protein [Ruminococcaceae bacterium]|nr:YitT family protein [Oscillospiraceae bacterium]
MRRFFMITAGCLLLAIGVYFFKIPNGFTTGGVTGVGLILAQFTPISTATWIIILNVFLLILGFIFLGKGNGIMTVYCSLLYSAVTYIFEVFVPISEPMSNQPLLELIYGIFISALGSAMIFNNDASSGGTDIIALILKKFTSIDVGKALLLVDFAVASSAFFVFDVQTGLFCLLGLFAKAFIVDAVIENFHTCKYFVVITTKKDEISEFIMNNLGHGATVSKVIGEYTKEEKTMLHTVCRRTEAIKLRNKIKEIDPEAFTIITTSSEIIGRGFRTV